MSIPKLSNSKHDGNGRFCFFYQVGNKGYKIYRTKRRALACLRTQRFFYKLGLAPKPGKYFVLRNPVRYGSYVYKYGYTTEVAEPADRHTSSHLYNMLYKRNIIYFDCIDFNLGVYRNKPVIVDCDPQEFTYNKSFTEFRKLARV